MGFYIGSWFLGGLITLSKGAWMGSGGTQGFDLNVLIILTAYLFLIYDATASCGFALGQGVLIDIFSGGLEGLFTSVYFGVFVSIYVLSLFFNLQDVKGQMVIVATAVLVKSLLLFLMLMVFSQQVVVSTAYLMLSGISIVVNSLLAPLLFNVLDRLRVTLAREDESGSPEQL